MKLKIDYPNHPGFKGVAEDSVRDIKEIDLVFSQLGDIYENFIQQNRKHSSAEISALVANTIQPQAETLKTIVSEVMKPGEWFKPVAVNAIDRFVETLRDEFMYRESQRRFRPQDRGQKVEQMVNDIKKNGIAIRNIDKHQISKIWSKLSDFKTALLNQKKLRPKGIASCMTSLPLKGDYWAEIKKVIDELGVLDAVNEYSRYPMDLDYCALQLSHEHEDWYQNCYADVGLPTQKTTYMHYDQDFSLMKAIMYLSDVDQNQGPFSYVEGNNFLHGSYVQQRFLTQLDLAAIAASNVEMKSKNLSYYRPTFKFTESRREFLKLPIQIQGTSGFGDDILDGTDLSNYLLGHEKKITSHDGNFALFTGGRIIHRGGTVPQGERWVFQFGFRQKDLSLRGRYKRAERQLKLRTPTVVKEAVKKIISIR